MVLSSNEETNKGYFLKIDIKHSEKLYEFHFNLPFLPEKMKIEKV